MVQIDVPGKPRRSREVPGSIFRLRPRKTGPKIFSQTAFDPGVLLKDPGVLLKDPGVLLKDPGVL